MKLYLKSEVDALLRKELGNNNLNEQLTPIEIPSDEQIHDECQIGGMDTNKQLCFQTRRKMDA